MPRRPPNPAKSPRPALAGVAGATPLAAADSAAEHPQSVLAILREWMDALIIAFVAAMFIRVFMVELFKIPTGSMTPTLVGGRVAEVDLNEDGRKDLLLLRDGQPPLAFTNEGTRLVARGPLEAPLFGIEGVERYDRILVNKLAYWFSQPRRGDIVVFKVPERIWDPTKPIYIKRCVGEPGDRLSFDAQGHLEANGRLVTRPDFFQTQSYIRLIQPQGSDFFDLPEVSYTELGPRTRRIERIHVPKSEIYVFGDNTHSSLDSRYWGGVPLDNVKGRAFFRYYPLAKMKLLHAGGVDS